ncbi:MAG: ThiF family adenylyltransferase [Pirellulales bacterium]|nr:ThiF family adenylyltransferase [Pirellulales bacterium]
MADTLARYARQINYAPLGAKGQSALLASTALIVGCGALGTVQANLLARAGVGRLRIVDRDFVELTNLQRQVLFDEEDLRRELPKAVAAANKLAVINSTITLEPIVADLHSGNIRELCQGVDCILDGTDNFETRFLINDAAHALGIPWIYGGCIGAEGQMLAILPGETPCLRCVLPEPPPPGTQQTCDTAGVLGPAAGIVAAWQAAEALKILSGNRAAVNRHWVVFDLWRGDWRQLAVAGLREAGGCGSCQQGEYPWLLGERGNQAAVLCGRNAVQLTFADVRWSLAELREKLRLLPEAQLSGNNYLLRLRVDPYLLTFFPDGRVIVQGTDDIAAAKTVFTKYLGG